MHFEVAGPGSRGGGLPSLRALDQDAEDGEEGGGRGCAVVAAGDGGGPNTAGRCRGPALRVMYENRLGIRKRMA